MAELTPEQQEALEKQKKQCPFCKLVKGDMESKKVYEDDLVIAIMDINPATKGHLLVMPKEHYPVTPLIPPETFSQLFIKTKELCQSITDGILAQGQTILVANGAAAGQQSAHFLLHIIPREEGDMVTSFDIPQNKFSEEDIEKTVELLKNNLAIMLRNHFSRMGKDVKIAVKPSEDHLLQILESNPQLKELLIKDVKKFEQLVETNPQAREFFEGADLQALRKKLGVKDETVVDVEPEEDEDVEETEEEPEEDEEPEEEEEPEEDEEPEEEEEPEHDEEPEEDEKVGLADIADMLGK